MRPVLGLGLLGLVIVAGCSPDVAASRHASALPFEEKPDWSTALPELLPGIRACLADGGAAAAGVTKAWPITSGLTGVRVLKTDGARYDCIATDDGRGVILVEPVRSLSHLEGESNPLYTPSPTEPTHAACVETNPVEGDVNAGWLSYDDCGRPRAIKPSAEADTPRQASPRRGAS